MFSLRYRPLHDFRNELNQMRGQLDELFGTSRSAATRTFPLVNAWEAEDSFYVEAELPGLELEDIEIYMADRDTLTIKGSRKEPKVEGGQWHRRERGFGAFERSLALPGAVNAEEVEASFKQGVLTVKLPKAAELRPRKIDVKAV